MRITADDMLAAHRLVHGERRGRRVVVEAGIAALGTALLFVVDDEMRPWLGLCVGLIVVALLAGVAVDRVWIPWRIAKLHAQHRSLHEAIEARVGDDGLHVTTPHATALLPWSHVIRWREGPSHVVLMQTDALMTVLPKRDFADGELDRLRAGLTAHVGPAR